jgi:hypothetical protein
VTSGTQAPEPGAKRTSTVQALWRRLVGAGRSAWAIGILVLATLVVLALTWIVLNTVNSRVRIDSYRVVDQRTIVVTAAVGPHSWTRVTGVTETATEVRVTVESLDVTLGPSAAYAVLADLTVSLSQDIDDRTVLDAAGDVVPRR